VVARAIARAVYEAARLRFPGALPSWKAQFPRAAASPQILHNDHGKTIS
jgi:hypothetical protein